jgi:hypothetical protein
MDWDNLKRSERVRLAAKYLGVGETEVSEDGLTAAADWFESLGPSQRLNVINAFFALGGGDDAAPERRALWDQIARLVTGEWNSQIGEVSVIFELRETEAFKRAAKAAGLKGDWAPIRWWFHRGASFSLREWRVRASLNVANDKAAARAAGQERGGGHVVRVEFDAYGPAFSLGGLLRHYRGQIDAQAARVELARRGIIQGEGSAAESANQSV